MQARIDDQPPVPSETDSERPKWSEEVLKIDCLGPEVHRNHSSQRKSLENPKTLSPYKCRQIYQPLHYSLRDISCCISHVLVLLAYQVETDWLMIASMGAPSIIVTTSLFVKQYAIHYSDMAPALCCVIETRANLTAAQCSLDVSIRVQTALRNASKPVIKVPNTIAPINHSNAIQR